MSLTYNKVYMDKKTGSFIVFFMVLIFILYQLFLLNRMNTDKIKILDIGINKVTKSHFCFTFESPYQESMLKLRDSEKLDEVIKSSQNEFEKIILLRNWVRKQWDAGEFPYPYPPWDALVILDWIREGKTKGFCGQYAIVFAQALISINIPVRYIDIANDKGSGHFLTEIWSRDFDKWVVMDPYFDIHFEQKNIPLNALELHNALCNNEYEDITIVKDNGIRYTGNDVKEKLNYYHTFGIIMRNNHISKPPVIFVLEDKKNKRRRVMHLSSMLKYRDKFNKIFANDYSSKQIEDFYWEPDLVNIRIKKMDNKSGKVTLKFENVISDGNFYYVYADTEFKEYQKVGGTFIWKLKRGYNKLYVTNKEYNFAEEGFAQSYISVEYNP